MQAAFLTEVPIQKGDVTPIEKLSKNVRFLQSDEVAVKTVRQITRYSAYKEKSGSVSISRAFVASYIGTNVFADHT